MILKQYTMDELLAMPVDKRTKILKKGDRDRKIAVVIGTTIKIIILPIMLLVKMYKWTYE